MDRETQIRPVTDAGEDAPTRQDEVIRCVDALSITVAPGSND